MRKQLPCLGFLLLFLCASSLFAQTPPPGISGQAFRDWIKTNFYDGSHTTLGYSTARGFMYGYIDNENDQLTGVYSGYQLPWAFGNTGTNPAPINAEHTVPQSFFGSAEPMRSDIHHLFPTYGPWNSTRSNFPFADIDDNTTSKWMYLDQSQTSIPATNIDLYSEQANSEFEPREDHKGDCARAIFYFYTMYPTQAGVITSVGDLNTLYQWHLADPPSTKEMLRNDGVETYQGNRNPYVDNPTWVSDAWEIGTSGLDTPSNFSLTVATASLDLSWNDIAGETGYSLYRSTDNQNFTLLSSLAANSVNYSDASVSTGTTYYYYIEAFDASGTSGGSSIVSGQLQGGGTGGDATDLLISEYIEGSSFNKALEIANNTGSTVALSGYVLKKQTNGAGAWGSDYALTGSLANGEVFVIANSAADPAILAEADVSTGSGIVTFNGNDAIGLFKNGTLIDILGTFNSAANYALNVTLVRKPEISSPVDLYNTGEWDSFASNTFTDLGSHTYVGSGPNPPAAPVNVDLLATTVDLNISWDDVAEEDGYLVYRSTDNSNFTQLTSLAANEVAYTDATVQLLTTYYYYVVAFNAGGNSANSAVVSGQTEVTGPLASELFISEYIEGSSFNKALEVANYTGVTVDLSGYVLSKQTNGSGAWGSDYALSGNLAHGEVFVIANSAADAAILAEADVSTGAGIVTFNGNDALALFKNGTLLDVLGTFNSAAVYAENTTLVRKAVIDAPNTLYTPAEWEVYASNTFTELGAHIFSGGGLNPPASPSNVSLTETVDDLQLSWDDLANEDGYTIYRSLDNSNFTELGTLAANTTSYTDNTVQLLTPYYYYLVAFNGDGNSLNSAVVSGQTIDNTPTASDLFISEYVEGSSKNRAIELANFTGNSIDLSIYSLKRQANGSGNWRNTYALNGTLADAAVLVIGHASAGSGVTSVADILTSQRIMNFSGNDPIGLFKNNVLIDIVGTFNGGSGNFAKNTTLVRKETITDPNTSYAVAEWDVYANNTFTFLGTHDFGMPPARLAATEIFREDLSKIKAWPNPFADQLVFSYQINQDTEVEIDMFSLQGQRVKTILSATNRSLGEYQKKISGENLPAGMYLIRIKTHNMQKFLRVLKQ